MSSDKPMTLEEVLREMEGSAYDYRLRWHSAIRAHLEAHASAEDKLRRDTVMECIDALIAVRRDHPKPAPEPCVCGHDASLHRHLDECKGGACACSRFKPAPDAPSVELAEAREALALANDEIDRLRCIIDHEATLARVKAERLEKATQRCGGGAS